MNLSKWYQFIKPNFKYYQDGFFEFPYLANTPELFIESTIKSPGSKHHVQEQVVYRNNPFIKGDMHYRKIDEGLWLTITNIQFKHDSVIKSAYAKDIPSEHYSITFTVYESDVKIQNVFIDKMPFHNKFWGFKKPGTDVGACFYKGSKCQFYIYYISPDWIKKNVPFERLDDAVPFKKFLNSDKGFISYQDIVPDGERLSHEILHTVKTFNDDIFNETLLKAQTFSLISGFFKNALIDSRKEEYLNKGAIDYKKISRCERLVSINLSKPFIGIEVLSQNLSMSPSKLKMDFKSVYGTSILQYNIEKKMELALQLLLNTNMQIKYIAQEVGYESHSKFSAAFKKKYGKLPSELHPDTEVN
ncbi:AraC family transcriptional regulator [Flavobacterium sp. LM4]|uniref:helix-turn-helix domain-containing protein n=1 Tax=Flavobacterium sp. LM4 TaxID=1938609 RepID=UPI0016714F43|nr:AraC family transcriptional regulator [Flavobacterium sp. LM4]